MTLLLGGLDINNTPANSIGYSQAISFLLYSSVPSPSPPHYQDMFQPHSSL